MSYFTDLAHQYIDGEWRTGSGSWTSSTSIRTTVTSSRP